MLKDQQSRDMLKKIQEDLLIGIATYDPEKT